MKNLFAAFAPGLNREKSAKNMLRNHVCELSNGKENAPKPWFFIRDVDVRRVFVPLENN